MRDINGREVRPGDLIRVFHYVDRRTKRKCYMHKLVVLVDDKLKVSRGGKHLWAVDVAGIRKSAGVAGAYKCRIEACGEFEIIDGLSRTLPNNHLETWYEREKVK